MDKLFEDLKMRYRHREQLDNDFVTWIAKKGKHLISHIIASHFALRSLRSCSPFRFRAALPDSIFSLKAENARARVSALTEDMEDLITVQNKKSKALDKNDGGAKRAQEKMLRGLLMKM